jgi:hypothetical protein
LSLWLDADETNTVVTDPTHGNRVVNWNDRSNQKWTAHATYVGSGHIDHASGIADNHSAMQFSGTDTNTGAFRIQCFDLNSQCSRASSLGFASDYVIVVVAAYENVPSWNNGGQAILFRDPASVAYDDGPWLIANSRSDSVIFAGTRRFDAPFNTGVWSSKNGWNSGTLHSFAMRYDKANQTMFVRTDGIETQSTPGVPIAGTGNNAWIGGAVAYGSNPQAIEHPLKGYIAEVMVAEYTFGTVSEMAQLSTYLQSKYNLPF